MSRGVDGGHRAPESGEADVLLWHKNLFFKKSPASKQNQVYAVLKVFSLLYLDLCTGNTTPNTQSVGSTEARLVVNKQHVDVSSKQKGQNVM